MSAIDEIVTQPINTYDGAYQFYEEYDVGSGGAVSTGNCIALFVTGVARIDGAWSCLMTLFHFPDGPVVYTSVLPSYLEQFCKEVTEEQARRIHPNLFRFLDQLVVP